MLLPAFTRHSTHYASHPRSPKKPCVEDTQTACLMNVLHIVILLPKTPSESQGKHRQHPLRSSGGFSWSVSKQRPSAARSDAVSTATRAAVEAPATCAETVGGGASQLWPQTFLWEMRWDVDSRTWVKGNDSQHPWKIDTFTLIYYVVHYQAPRIPRKT